MPKDATALQQTSLSRWIWLAFLIVLVDQISKVIAEASLTYGQRVNVFPFFDFTLLYNPGAAFSFLANQGGWQRWFFTLVGVLAIAFIAYLMRKHREDKRFLLALTLIMGGAAGNLIDRVLYGHVIDFLLFYWEKWHYPAFNLADSAITVGAVLLILDELMRLRRTKANADTEGMTGRNSNANSATDKRTRP